MKFFKVGFFFILSFFFVLTTYYTGSNLDNIIIYLNSVVHIPSVTKNWSVDAHSEESLDNG